MLTKTRATYEDLMHVEGKAEIVDGEIAELPMTGDKPNRASGEIYFHLKLYEKTSSLGRAYTDGVAYRVRLPHRGSFSPDVSFFTGPRSGMKFLDGAPVFAVEVRSEYDYGETAEREMTLKRADYFRAGTLVVWDVDVRQGAVIYKYTMTSPETSVVFAPGEEADAEPALPGWKMPVDALVEEG